MNRQTVIISLILIAGLGSVAFLSYVSVQNAPPAEELPLANPPSQEPYIIDIVRFEPSLYIGDETEVVWQIRSDTQEEVSHTELHYSTNISPEKPESPAAYAAATEMQGGTAPGTFSALFSFQDEGLIYFKAYALIKGSDVWSREYMILSKPASWKQTPENSSAGGGGSGGKGGSSNGGSSGGSSGNSSGNQSVYVPQNYSYNLEIDDLGFYNGEQQLSSLSFRQGDKLSLTFQVRTENVNPAGFKFASPSFQSPRLWPGQSWSAPQITLIASFIITATDPSTEQEVAEFEILVN